MKEHFKYAVSDGAMSIGRPILSTRQNYSSQLQQRVFEQKILETLRDQNQTDKYDEFLSAQKLAAVMMDIVSSSQSDHILEPAGRAKSGTRLKTVLPSVHIFNRYIWFPNALKLDHGQVE